LDWSPEGTFNFVKYIFFTRYPYSKGKAQGHKNWCGLECGEEDQEWKIVFIPGRRAGIRAKKLLPPLFRIMVEGFDRSLDVLNPTNQKAIYDSRRRAKIPNHECDANAGLFPVLGDKLNASLLGTFAVL
jgi:hypothetical protein